jgi:hypothetical protein
MWVVDLAKKYRGFAYRAFRLLPSADISAILSQTTLNRSTPVAAEDYYRKASKIQWAYFASYIQVRP